MSIYAFVNGIRKEAFTYNPRIKMGKKYYAWGPTRGNYVYTTSATPSVGDKLYEYENDKMIWYPDAIASGNIVYVDNNSVTNGNGFSYERNISRDTIIYAIKKIIEGYTFINGVRKKLFGKWSFDHTEIYTSDTQESLPIGNYQIVCRGAGGAGGQTGGGYGNSSGGVGGCGAKGELSVNTAEVATVSTADIIIGTGGKTFSNGGNGGEKGYTAGNVAPDAGSGGGGGMPSYVQINTNFYIADGGGGGGGGGAAGSANRRYDSGGAGGGGGGFYKTEIINDDIVITSVAGKKGANGTVWGQLGASGVNGDGDPALHSGAGGKGSWNDGGSNATGGGASGAAGGGGPGNDNTGAGGNGGGGAGGSADAGGGNNAINTAYSYFNSSVFATNAGKTTPTDTLAENQTYGVNANYGIGGGTNLAGAQGFVVIRRIKGTPTRTTRRGRKKSA